MRTHLPNLNSICRRVGKKFITGIVVTFLLLGSFSLIFGNEVLGHGPKKPDNGGFSEIPDDPPTPPVNPPNCPPLEPCDPFPGDDADYIPLGVTLSWMSDDPDVGDTVEYDVYFGTASDPPLVDTVAVESYDPGILNYETTYYWRIVARDNHGKTSEGLLWQFFTGEILEGDADCDGHITADDIKLIRNHLLLGADEPPGEADSNEDGHINIADIIYLCNIVCNYINCNECEHPS
jgi:hypothetical protein